MPYLFKNGLFHGLGWAFGATIGFLIISSVLVFVLRALGGLPLIGRYLTPVIQSTENQLELRTPLTR